MHRLKKEIQTALKELKFSSLTEVQHSSLEPALAGKDLIVQSYTGTGKTGAFLLPALNRLSPHRHVQVLVLTPTRELAVQVASDCRKLSKHMQIGIATVYGGASAEKQISDLRRGCQIVVGTPGRVLDLIQRGELHLDKLSTLVLDEADVMLDMGFQRDVERILSFTPSTRQTMLFCVDLPGEIKVMTHRYMHSPLRINLLKEEKTVASVAQWVYPVHPAKKFSFLIHLLNEMKPTRSIIFCRTKYSTKKLAFQLQRKGFHCQELHGNLTQSRRDKIMNSFKQGKIDLLIATDVAARGIHVNQVSHIFNYELPADIKYYLHRIGRTGRMDQVGDAVSLVSQHEEQTLREIEILIGKKLERREVPPQFKSVVERQPRRAHGFHSFSYTKKNLFS
ncbi:DEAD/DEAH box helicase [Candidatus Micrarchaeota archaeon]|nr:DEAD/DEAH box helicase [Candidatus Micrarchaeota archaeon]